MSGRLRVGLRTIAARQAWDGRKARVGRGFIPGIRHFQAGVRALRRRERAGHPGAADRLAKVEADMEVVESALVVRWAKGNHRFLLEDLDAEALEAERPRWVRAARTLRCPAGCAGAAPRRRHAGVAARPAGPVAQGSDRARRVPAHAGRRPAQPEGGDQHRIHRGAARVPHLRRAGGVRAGSDSRTHACGSGRRPRLRARPRAPQAARRGAAPVRGGAVPVAAAHGDGDLRPSRHLPVDAVYAYVEEFADTSGTVAPEPARR